MVVPPLVVHPQPGLQGGVGQPAEAAEGRRGEEAAARREPSLLQPPVPGIERRLDYGGVERGASVALHEDQEHVPAPQAGQQVVVRGVAERVMLERPHELLLVAEVVTDLRGEPSRGGRGDLSYRLRPGAGQSGDHRDRGQDGDDPDRRPPVSRHEPGQAQRRQRQQDEQGHAEQSGSDEDCEGAYAADRVAEQAQRGAGVRRVVDRVEGAVEGEVEASVEQPQQRQQAESETADQREDPRRSRWQHHNQDAQEQALERDPEEGGRRQVADVVRHEQRSPDQEQRQRGSHGGTSAGPASGQAPQPPNLTPERLGQQPQRDEQHDGGHGIGQDAGRRDG